MLEVHLCYLSAHIEQGKRLGPRGPICRDLLWHVDPSAIRLFLGTKTIELISDTTGMEMDNVFTNKEAVFSKVGT
jgi:hypothetical protein